MSGERLSLPLARRALRRNCDRSGLPMPLTGVQVWVLGCMHGCLYAWVSGCLGVWVFSAQKRWGPNSRTLLLNLGLERATPLLPSPPPQVEGQRDPRPKSLPGSAPGRVGGERGRRERRREEEGKEERGRGGEERGEGGRGGGEGCEGEGREGGEGGGREGVEEG